MSRRLLCHPLIPVAAAVLFWVLAGTVCYWLLANCSEVPEFDGRGGIQQVEYCPWTFAQSFYYSVQAGLSIGYGLLAETSDLSRLFTVIYILAGSSFIAGALAFLVQFSLTKQGRWQNSEERKLAKFSSDIHADGYRGFNLQEVRELLVCHPSHMRDISMLLEGDYRVVCERMKAFNAAGLKSRAAMASDVLKEACEKLEEFQGGRVSIRALLRLHRREATFCGRCFNFLTAHRNIFRVLIANIVWIALGALYVCCAEGVSLVTGLYFAVSSLSTAGLYSVTSTADGFVFWFTGVYCLIGVPLYAMLLGSYANLFMEQYEREKTLEAVHQRMNRAELAVLQHLVRQEHKEHVSFADYAELQLLRLGKVDFELLDQLREDFRSLDLSGNGRVPLESFISPQQNKRLQHCRAARQGEQQQTEARTRPRSRMWPPSPAGASAAGASAAPRNALSEEVNTATV